jgi:hypothetical protein
MQLRMQQPDLLFTEWSDIYAIGLLWVESLTGIFVTSTLFKANGQWPSAEKVRTRR